MASTEDQEFDEAFKGFGEDPTPVTPPVTDPPTPPVPPAAAEVPKPDPATPPVDNKPKEGEADADKNKPGNKPEGDAKPDDQTPPAPSSDKPDGEGKDGTDGTETPPVPEEAKPLTKDDVTSIIKGIQIEERTSGQALEDTTKEVLEAYYPDGLSNTLIDQASGKELKTPADVVAVAPDMSMEDAAQWLMNEQYKLDQDVAKIRSDAKAIAETTLKFKQDGLEVLERYEPVFKAYPQLQKKVWDQYKKLVKADEAKGVVLSAPDMLEFYDTVLDPYRLAVEYGTQNPGTNPTPPASLATPPAPAPGADDRLDEGGDGGQTPPDDPNDFAQQVSKELAKGI